MGSWKCVPFGRAAPLNRPERVFVVVPGAVNWYVLVLEWGQLKYSTRSTDETSVVMVPNPPVEPCVMTVQNHNHNHNHMHPISRRKWAEPYTENRHKRFISTRLACFLRDPGDEKVINLKEISCIWTTYGVLFGVRASLQSPD